MGKRLFLAIALVAVALGLGAAPSRAEGESDWRWSQPSAMAEYRANAASAVLEDGRVLVAGGVGNDALASAEAYDPATRTWSSLPPMDVTRWFPAAAAVSGDRALVIGQADFYNHPVGSATYQVFDGATNTWSPSKSFLSTAYDGYLHTLRTGKVLYASVADGSGLYDASTDTWTALSVPWTGYNRPGSLTELADGKILVTTTPGSVANGAYEFDPQTESWTTLPAPDVRVSYLQTALLGDGRVLATADWFDFDANTPRSAAYVFDAADATWTPAATPQPEGAGGRLISAPDGAAIRVGLEQYTPQDGCPCGSVEPQTTVTKFDPTTSAWQPAADLHVARAYPFLVRTANSVLAFGGGYGNRPEQNSSEEYFVPRVVPVATIANTSVAEGGDGTVDMEFTVHLNAPVDFPVVVSGTTGGGTAKAGDDYVGGRYSVTFAPGATTQTIRVPVRGDTTPESNETFKLTFDSPDAAFSRGEAVGTIVDDDLGACATAFGARHCVGIQNPLAGAH
jgi:N-acetylneuraminic acid mutarotase